ncbi:hypothetical protein BZA05DRAFT_420751 [Tricharina praecox]|uniref:uncharacterized protein n=1 Tax=Tricharina praecox TaxID=43433 RepID=UPI00221EBE3A|nr:uncharacterized protein BZA05DRAFT_420751 [Tricharina praecox]KAI5846917.1 hypothetical protein BZA05DRAFT_420751 [Tricharina praecox]
MSYGSRVSRSRADKFPIIHVDVEPSSRLQPDIPAYGTGGPCKLQGDSQLRKFNYTSPPADHGQGRTPILPFSAATHQPETSVLEGAGFNYWRDTGTLETRTTLPKQTIDHAWMLPVPTAIIGLHAKVPVMKLETLKIGHRKEDSSPPSRHHDITNYSDEHRVDGSSNKPNFSRFGGEPTAHPSASNCLAGEDEEEDEDEREQGEQVG